MAESWFVRPGDLTATLPRLTGPSWPDLDLSTCKSQQEVRERLRRAHLINYSKYVRHASQMWRFSAAMRPGDYIIVPRMGQSGRVAIGQVVGRYRFMAEAPRGLRHTRAVEWLREDLQVERLDHDLRRRVSSPASFVRLSMDRGGRRLAALARGMPDPGPRRIEEGQINTRYRVSVIDVGDGGCTVIRTPGDGREALTVVDCGSASLSADEACDRLLEAVDGRPEQITTIVVTHFDADHYRGFVRLADRMFARGQHFDSLRLISPRIPDVAPNYPAALLAMQTTITGIRSLDLLVQLEQVTSKGRLRYTPLSRGSSFLAGGRGYEVLWPPPILPGGVTRQVRSAVSAFERLADTLADLGNTSLRDNYAAAREGGWLRARPPEDVAFSWTMDADRFADLSPDEDLGGPHTAEPGVVPLDLPEDLQGVFQEVWDVMRRANNNMSLVIEDAEPGRFIAFGDAGPPVLSRLAETELGAAHYAVMLAPHHGTQRMPRRLGVTADLCVSQNGSRRSHLWKQHHQTHVNQGHCVTSASGSQHLMLL